MPGNVRIGISGWRYDGWRGSFYPEDLVQRRELEFASRKLPSIELNGSFYSLQRPERYARWRDETPDDFVFSVKAPKFITHVRKLVDVERPVANFLASGLFALGAKLGPILWQFAPSFRFNEALFETFLSVLPKDTEQALALARGHDAWMAKRSYLEIDAKRPLRHAVEIRNASFANAKFVGMLARHGVAAVVADTAGKWPLLEDVTSDFLYLRLHGDEELYVSGYTDEALTRWARRIELWSNGAEPSDAHRVLGPAESERPRDVYCYFDNDVKARAPADAQRLLQLLGLEWTPAEATVKPRAPTPPPRATPTHARAARAARREDEAPRAARRAPRREKAAAKPTRVARATSDAAPKATRVARSKRSVVGAAPSKSKRGGSKDATRAARER